MKTIKTLLAVLITSFLLTGCVTIQKSLTTEKSTGLEYKFIKIKNITYGYEKAYNQATTKANELNKDGWKLIDTVIEPAWHRSSSRTSTSYNANVILVFERPINRTYISKTSIGVSLSREHRLHNAAAPGGLHPSLRQRG